MTGKGASVHPIPHEDDEGDQVSPRRSQRAEGGNKSQEASPKDGVHTKSNMGGEAAGEIQTAAIAHKNKGFLHKRISRQWVKDTTRAAKKNDQSFGPLRSDRLTYLLIDWFINHNVTQVALGVMLIVSLFLVDIWVLANPSNDADVFREVILTLAFVMFVFECAGLSLVRSSYLYSFFWYMDILGTASMLLDLDWVGIRIEDSGQAGDSTNLLRAARAAKIGAKSGRLAKLMRLFRVLALFFYNDKKEGEGGEEDTSLKTVKVLSARLSNLLAQRVAALVMIIVLASPFLTFSDTNLSPTSWLESYDSYVSTQPCDLNCTQAYADDVVDFFDNNGYFRVLEMNFLIDGEWTNVISKSDADVRDANHFTVEKESVEATFDTTFSVQQEALLSILFNVLIVILLIHFSHSFHVAVQELVVRPLDRIMDMLRNSVNGLVLSMKSLDTTQEETDEIALVENALLETDMLEAAIEKLVAIAERVLPGNRAPVEDLEQLDDETQAWMNHEYDVTCKLDSKESFLLKQAQALGEGDEIVAPQLTKEQQTLDAQLDTFDTDLLSMKKVDLFKFVERAFHKYDMFTDMHINEDDFRRFLTQLEAAYISSNPYHNFYHGVDVMHMFFRMIRISNAATILSKQEIFAGLTAAVSHDVGHLGVNNAYLVRSQHGLALTHNDNSPLENMHCATLYQISKTPNCDIFSGLTKEEYKAVRKLIIAAILHTDMKYHFKTVADVQVSAELYGSDYLEAAKKQQDPQLVISQKEFLVSVFLHAADISNPIRPFAVCKKWATLVIQEFFAQGDREKAEGLEVSPMMDRDKGNFEQMQFDFIDIIVAPLYLGLVDLFPGFGGAVQQMVSNATNWKMHRVEAMSVSDDAEAIEKLEARCAALNAKWHAKEHGGQVGPLGTGSRRGPGSWINKANSKKGAELK